VGGRRTRRTLTTDNASQIFILKPIATLSGSFAVLYKVAIKATDLNLLIMFASDITASAFLAIILVKLFKEMENE
jgi:hypothetical protein